MILLQEHLAALEHHWAVAAISESSRERAHDVANYRLVKNAVGGQLRLQFKEREPDEALIVRLAMAYEVAAAEGLDALLHHTTEERKALAIQAQAGAFRAFELRRTLPIPTETTERIFHVLHLASLAYAGDRWADLRRWLFDHEKDVDAPAQAPAEWELRVLYRVYEAWLRLFRKNSWADVNGIATIVASLRVEQQQYEPDALERGSIIENKVTAIQLVALYHWAKATELLALYMLQGQPGGIREQLDLHFEKAIRAASTINDMRLEMLLRWLHVAGRHMVANSLWAATAHINSRVTKFVNAVVRAAHPMLELLPPQRAALAEQGLLNPASRAVVVDLPTSGGKTTLAQFRILQALNAFAQDGGFVVYVAPTRALVAQLVRRLRRDFGPLGIKVEQMSGGIDIDSFEEDLLGQKHAFDVLVSTPEKLSLVIRNGKLEHRPLALVVVDEAHNIEDEERGLRIELLLATIRQDCPKANYLLLMPFVPHSEMLSRWLDPEAGQSISLSTAAWQPNERIIGLFKPEQTGEIRGRRPAWALSYEAVTTGLRTIHLYGNHRVGNEFPLDLPYSKADSLMMATAAMAKVFSTRGTSIAIGDSIPNAWKMADTIADNMSTPTKVSEEVALVQAFLRTEVGPDFKLIKLLEKGVGVHHSGLPDDARALIEWLAEEGHLRVLCATTTIAQGINFPVSSIFISRIEHPTKHGPKPMSSREFWNLAGRAGRVGQDSVGVVGIATSDEEKTKLLKAFVADRTAELASRLITILDELIKRAPDDRLAVLTREPQWADFRSFIAHLLKQSADVYQVLGQTEQLLRATLGYSVLRNHSDPQSRARADALVEVTKEYAQQLSKKPAAVQLADSTGFDPEGVSKAIVELGRLETKLTPSDWQPSSLFGRGKHLSHLIGVMMKLPNLSKNIEEIAGEGMSRSTAAKVAKAWVRGDSFQDIATEYFKGDASSDQITDAITDACKGISKALLTSGVWGLSALSKLPNSGIDWDKLSEDQKRKLNMLPAFLYYGVDNEDAVLMRMNQVPRSVAVKLGTQFRRESGAAATKTMTVAEARDYVKGLSDKDWDRVRARASAMSGAQYREVWRQLSGEKS
jgi:replicative superfamily II helicase